jgi:hypothetical protein
MVDAFQRDLLLVILRCDVVLLTALVSRVLGVMITRRLTSCAYGCIVLTR